MDTEPLDILHQMGRGIIFQPTQRTRTAGATLVEDDDPPKRRVEEPPMHRARARAGSTVDEKHRISPGIAGLLPVHDVGGRERQVTGLEWSDLGEEVTTGHRAGSYRRRRVGET